MAERELRPCFLLQGPPSGHSHSLPSCTGLSSCPGARWGRWSVLGHHPLFWLVQRLSSLLCRNIPCLHHTHSSETHPHTDGCCQPIHYSFTATAHSSASYLACETLQCLVAPVTKPERTRAPWPILSPSLLCSSSASPHHGHTLVLPLHPFLFSIVLTLLLKPVQCKCSGKRDLRSSPAALQFLGPAAL